jgi:hypothetical protein
VDDGQQKLVHPDGKQRFFMVGEQEDLEYQLCPGWDILFLIKFDEFL